MKVLATGHGTIEISSKNHGVIPLELDKKMKGVPTAEACNYWIELSSYAAEILNIAGPASPPKFSLDEMTAQANRIALLKSSIGINAKAPDFSFSVALNSPDQTQTVTNERMIYVDFLVLGALIAYSVTANVLSEKVDGSLKFKFTDVSLHRIAAMDKNQVSFDNFVEQEQQSIGIKGCAWRNPDFSV